MREEVKRVEDFFELAVKNLNFILKQALEKTLKQENLKEDKLEFLIQEPQREEFGDFASNIAMVYSKVFRISPLKLAEKLAKNIILSDSFFKEFEIKPPGFINFFLSSSWHIKVLEEILKQKNNFGKTNYGGKKKVILEFVSANPTGPMHIGNARGGAIGDSLAECFKFAGFFVFKEFYVNDAGKQIKKFKDSLMFRLEQILNKEKEIKIPTDCYLGEDITELSEEFLEENKEKIKSYSKETVEKEILTYSLSKNIHNLKKDLLNYNIEYDNWFFESSLHENGEVLKVIDLLKQKGYTKEKDGAIWFLNTKCGGEKDEVLVRENLIPTYFAADIAYHYNKFKKRGFDFAVDVWGADHHGHVKRLKNALNVLGGYGEFLDVVLMQMVRLVKKGETLKLSKRKGNAVSLNDLLSLIPVDVARFFFNFKEPNTHFDFDLDLAKEQSEKNPVYYLQYAYARVCGILKKLKSFDEKLNLEEDLKKPKTNHELELIKQMAKFPQEIILAVELKNPSKIAHFAIKLATLFHRFYVNCKIKGEKEELILNRLLICNAVKIVFENVFLILKVEAKEQV